MRTVFSSGGILGPAPNSPESSSFQHGRNDVEAINWLDNNHRLWKPRGPGKSHKPKNKSVLGS